MASPKSAKQQLLAERLGQWDHDGAKTGHYKIQGWLVCTTVTRLTLNKRWTKTLFLVDGGAVLCVKLMGDWVQTWQGLPMNSWIEVIGRIAPMNDKSSADNKKPWIPLAYATSNGEKLEMWVHCPPTVVETDDEFMPPLRMSVLDMLPVGSNVTIIVNHLTHHDSTQAGFNNGCYVNEEIIAAHECLDKRSLLLVVEREAALQIADFLLSPDPLEFTRVKKFAHGDGEAFRVITSANNLGDNSTVRIVDQPINTSQDDHSSIFAESARNFRTAGNDIVVELELPDDDVELFDKDEGDASPVPESKKFDIDLVDDSGSETPHYDFVPVKVEASPTPSHADHEEERPTPPPLEKRRKLKPQSAPMAPIPTRKSSRATKPSPKSRATKPSPKKARK